MSNSLMPKVSVIVPCYNSEKTLRRCLDCLQGQSLPDMEIICINDGSTDGTLDLLNSYVAKDSRFKVINQSNQGQSVARNTGLKEASGEYVGFVDSDDYVDETFYETLVSAALSKKCDMALAGICACADDRKKFKSQSGKVLRGFTKSLKELKDGAVCNKLFRRELVKDIEFPSGVLFEDNLYLVKALYKADGIVCVPNVFYYYVYRPDSTTNSFSKKEQLKKSAIELLKRFNAFAEENDLSVDETRELFRFAKRSFAKHYLAANRFELESCLSSAAQAVLFKEKETLSLIKIIKAYLLFPIYIMRIYQMMKEASK